MTLNVLAFGMAYIQICEIYDLDIIFHKISFFIIWAGIEEKMVEVGILGIMKDGIGHLNVKIY